MLRILALTTLIPLSAALPASAQGLETDVGPGGMSAPLTREEVREIVKQVIREEPQLIMDSLTDHEIARVEAARQEGLDAAQALLTNADFPYIGNKDATPSGVVFLDYNCPHCRRTHAEIMSWLSRNPDKSLRIVEFPVLGQGSLVAARAALAAHDSGQYDKVSAALVGVDGQNTPENIEQTLTKSGADVGAVLQGFNADSVTERIQEGNALAQKLGITGTPGAVFGGEVISGAFTASDLDEWVK